MQTDGAKRRGTETGIALAAQSPAAPMAGQAMTLAPRAGDIGIRSRS